MNLSDLLKLRRVEKSSTQLAQLLPHFYAEAQALLITKDQYEAKKAKEVYDDIVFMRQHKILMGCLRHLQDGDMPINMLGSEKDAYNRIFSELQSLKTGKMEVVEQEAPEPIDESQETMPEAMEISESANGMLPSEETVPKADAVESKRQVSKSTAKPTAKPAANPVAKPGNAGQDVFKGETENKALRRVRFLRPMPAFVGPDLESIGPFDEDTVADLDGDVAEILLKNDAVELM